LDETTSKTFGKDRTQWKEPPVQTKSRRGEDLLLRFNVSTPEDVASLAEIASYMYLDVWEYAEDWVDIRMAKDVLPHVLKQLPENMQHSHTALLQEKEFAQAIYDSYPSPRTSGQSASSADQPYGPALRPATVSEPDTNIFFQDYQPMSVIKPWLKLLASLFTTHVRMINIGITYEGRDIPAVRVGVHPTNNDDSAPRKTVLVTGGVHAREWISTSTVNYLAYSLITGYGKSPEITALVESFDWVFVPTINPDGYVYSWESDRLWRKNRQRTPLRFCYGVDLDRTFSFEWDGTSTSRNPCSESYNGDAPFDGVESQALANWALNETENNNVEFIGFLDLHSYSQQILYPYSYSCDALPPSLENLEELAAGLAKAIRSSHGHQFQAAPACEGNVAAAAIASGNKDNRIFPRFEGSGGSALDWFYHELKVRYTYQIKLRDRGSYGFLLPKEHIIPSGKEMLDAIMYFGRYVGVLYGMKGFSADDLFNEKHGPIQEADNVVVDSVATADEEWIVVDMKDGEYADQGHALEAEDTDGFWDLKRRRRR